MRSKLLILAAALSAWLLLLSLYGLASDGYADYKREHALVATGPMLAALDQSFARNGLSAPFLADYLVQFRRSVNYDWPQQAEYMPQRENWILASMAVLDPVLSRWFMRSDHVRLFGNVELPEYEHALARGFGICSQLSLASADLLYRRYGIDARVAGLDGHVVVQLYDGAGGGWVLDPSFRNFTRGSVTAPAALAPAFFAGNKKIRALYLDARQNYVAPRPGWAAYSQRSAAKQELLFRFVLISYALKWLVPLAALGAALMALARARRRPARGAAALAPLAAGG
jgi:hypothetical protein